MFARLLAVATVVCVVSAFKAEGLLSKMTPTLHLRIVAAPLALGDGKISERFGKGMGPGS